jgi:hypothetical protein
MQEQKLILYNLASRSRPDRFWAAVENIAQVEHGSYLILAKLDRDDASMMTEEQRLKMLRQPFLRVEMGEGVSKIVAINRNIPLEGWDVLVNMSDDMQLMSGFSDLVRAACGPDDFLHLPDSYAKLRVCTLSILGCDYYRRDGYVYNPAYYSMWCDDEATEVAKSRGRYKLGPEGYVSHLHYSNGRAVKDELYWRNDTYNADKEIYLRRKGEGWP